LIAEQSHSVQVSAGKPVQISAVLHSMHSMHSMHWFQLAAETSPTTPATWPWPGRGVGWHGRWNKPGAAGPDPGDKLNRKASHWQRYEGAKDTSSGAPLKNPTNVGRKILTTGRIKEVGDQFPLSIPGPESPGRDGTRPHDRAAGPAHPAPV
jgi:hypothetical protein